MVIGLVFGLIVGWFISLFGANTLIIQGIFELTGKEISIADIIQFLLFWV